MITLKILAPLGRVLKLTENYYEALTYQAPFTPGVNIDDLISWLARGHVEFKRSLSQSNDVVVQEMIISVNGRILSYAERKLPLADESAVEFIVPYTGG